MSEKMNKKMLQTSEDKGIIDGWKLRLWYNKGDKKHSPHYLVKCGCCNESVKIYYNEDSVEINGVIASKDEWRKLFKMCGFE